MHSFHGDRQCISVTRMKGSSKLMASITLNFVLINLYVTSNGLTVVTEIAKLCVHVHTDQLNSCIYMYCQEHLVGGSYAPGTAYMYIFT